MAPIAPAAQFPELQNPGSERLFFSQEEFASLFGLSVHTVIRDVRLKAVECRRYGRRVLIPRSEVVRIANEGLK